MIVCSATNLLKDSWRQAEARIMLFVGGVAVKALAHGALRRVSSVTVQPPFQLGGGHATILLIWLPIFSFKALALFREG